jgi:hypothetical protein
VINVKYYFIKILKNISVTIFNMSTSNTNTTETKDKEKESKLKTELRQYQKKTFDSFAKEELADEIPHAVEYEKMCVDDFLRKVKEDKGPIQKIITYMKRMPKVVRDEKGIATEKDFLEVHSELRGVDWKDNFLRVTDYFDGLYYEPIIYTVTKGRDDETGDLILDKQHQGDRKVHDIELTDKNRKQVISDIINNATGTYTNEIKFYYQVPDSIRGPSHRDDSFTYDQFINSSPEEMANITWTRPSPIHSNKDKKPYMG